MNKLLTCFLYILLRDGVVSAGSVELALDKARGMTHEILEHADLEEYAEVLASRLEEK